MLARTIARDLLKLVVTVLLGGLLAATLARFAPGFDTDEQQLDSRLSAESQEALRAQHAGEKNVFTYYTNFLTKAAHGDFGMSHTLNRPVNELVGERLPVTLKLVALGLLAGWSVGFSLAVTTAIARVTAYDVFATAIAGLFLCIPSAVLALAFVFANAPGYLAIALIIFPKVFRYWRNLLDKSYSMPHIVTARAKGISPLRILVWHVLPVSAGQLLAVAGISVSVALGAAIPVEALCGIPGVGQLAWQAALGRDLSLLVTLTFLVTTLTLLANSVSDVLGRNFKASEA